MEADKYLTNNNIDVNIKTESKNKETIMPGKKKTKQTLEVPVDTDETEYLLKEDSQEFMTDLEKETTLEAGDLFKKPDEYVVTISLKAQYSSKLDGGDKHSSVAAEIKEVPAIWRSKIDNTVGEITDYVVNYVHQTMRDTMPRLFGINPTLTKNVDNSNLTDEQIAQEELDSR